MVKLSTTSRLSLGLVLLTISVVMSAYLLNLIPDSKKMNIAERKVISETFAVLCSKAAEKNDADIINQSIMTFVDRTDWVLSAAMRKSDGTLTAASKNHGEYWKGAEAQKSTETHIRVPIYQGNHIWGYIEVACKPIESRYKKLELFAFIFCSCFLFFRFFLKRVLQHMDPTSVVPPRVRTALDTLVEGVVLLDNDGRVVLANDTFSKKINKTGADITGQKIEDLNWGNPEGDIKDMDYPWITTLKGQDPKIGIPLILPDDEGHNRTFMINTSPIIDSTGKVRGVMVTFDDVTQVEEKNEQLKQMVQKLERYSERIKQQNQKLEFLATRDPLTGCRNRRSFFEIFDKEFNSAKRYGYKISCVMFDIDHFKSINDNHGHAAGDDVLRGFSSIIGGLVRTMDTMGRYGGEEFCIILPHIDIHNAAIAAERFRAAVEANNFSGITVTASFGISSIDFGAKDPSEMIDQADQALYAAKKGGRNRVVTWIDLYPDQLQIVHEIPPDTALNEENPSAGFYLTGQKDLSESIITEMITPPESSKSMPPPTNDLSDSENQNVDRMDALRLVHDSLAEHSRKSKSLGLHTQLDNDENAVVQLNTSGAWGDDETPKDTDMPKNMHPVSQVAKILKKNS
jgi:diguanylate cyclase (GGDEF)-like protein/PAS domain S-box-containing protein